MLGDVRIFSRSLLKWYDASRRDLPWRASGGREINPYHVLVSEAMLQQTQVATVIPYFNRFIEQFPSLQALADAPEQAVLRAWQGLGYYSRARNLQAAARKVVAEHGGRLPCEVCDLLTLPGVGRYTAGAVASIAFGRRAPIVDGNVMRVLCRIDKIETDPREKTTLQRLWSRAEEILPKSRTGDFNSALMELGATVCAPRNPQCLVCPVRVHCEAAAAGVQERIPAPRKAKPLPNVKRQTYCISRRVNGEAVRYLIEQRPSTGRWANMWQFITLEDGRPGVSVKPRSLKKLGEIEHTLTHRHYTFEVFQCESADVERSGGTWVTLEELNNYPMPRPHLKIAKMLAPAECSIQATCRSNADAS